MWPNVRGRMTIASFRSCRTFHSRTINMESLPVVNGMALHGQWYGPPLSMVWPSMVSGVALGWPSMVNGET